MSIQPFVIDIPDETINHLNRRLQDTRWPDEIPGSSWDYGSNLAYVRELCEYWHSEFDWRGQEAKLNEFDHFRADYV